MTKKSRTYLYHILFWAGIYLLWILLFRSYSIPVAHTVTIEFCYLLFVTADYYIVSGILFPRLLAQKKYLLFSVATVVLILLSAWLRSLVAQQMAQHFFHTVQLPPFATLLFNSAVNISFWVLLITVVGMLADRKQHQREMELAEYEKRSNELNFLKAQINPHALFNSLNTIYGYIDKSNQDARNVLLQFSELLRYQLYDCSVDKVPLAKELDFLQEYIAFHQLRKSDDVIVEVQIANAPDGLMIAPLLLLVLVENAFKFVSGDGSQPTKISVVVDVEGALLTCSVINTVYGQSSTTAGQGGIGLINLKRRLALLYPDKHTLTGDKDEDVYKANVTINLS